MKIYPVKIEDFNIEQSINTDQDYGGGEDVKYEQKNNKTASPPKNKNQVKHNHPRDNKKIIQEINEMHASITLPLLTT